MPFTKKTLDEERPRTLGVIIFGMIVTHVLLVPLVYLTYVCFTSDSTVGGLVFLAFLCLFARSELPAAYRRMWKVRFHHRRVIKLSQFMKQLLELCEPEVVYGGRSLTHGDGFVLTRTDSRTLIIDETGTYLLGWSPVCLWSPVDPNVSDIKPYDMEIASEDQLRSLLRKLGSYR